MQGLILAAGRGTRLQPFTNTRTKAMAPIAGKPIVERVMAPMAANGITDFVVVYGPDDPEIQSYFQKNAPAEWRISWAVQRERRGMGDALRSAIEQIHDDFMLSACDNLVPEGTVDELLRIWRQTPGLGGVLTLMQVPREKISRSGIVELSDNRITRIVEKPQPDEAPTNIASMPLYIFEKELMAHIPNIPLSKRGEYELQDAIQMHIDSGAALQGHRIETRQTLTSPADLLSINLRYLETENPDYFSVSAKLGKNSSLVSPYFVEDGVVIGNDCEIGSNVFIENGAQIGSRVTLKNAVVLRNAIIPDDTDVQDEVIFSE
ncbi:MAG: sugar phosphate nucleotidyltransferase [Calditrichia bacterium]